MNTTVDRNGDLHDPHGQYTHKGNSQAGYDLGAPGAPEPEIALAQHGDPDNPIPHPVASAIAAHHFGAGGYVVPGVSATTHWSLDGGGYTLHGTRIVGADGEHALVYRDEDGAYVTAFYDGSGSTWRDNADGTLTKTDWYSGDTTTVPLPASATEPAVEPDDAWDDEPPTAVLRRVRVPGRAHR